jgi:hypothetical protein
MEGFLMVIKEVKKLSTALKQIVLKFKIVSETRI